jgi:hypothetical protein
MSDRIYNNDGLVRVRIEQADGVEILPGIVAADPEAAKPYFEKLGWCDEQAFSPELGRPNPKITLDDGSVLWGYECWWSYVLAEHE